MFTMFRLLILPNRSTTNLFVSITKPMLYLCDSGRTETQGVRHFSNYWAGNNVAQSSRVESVFPSGQHRVLSATRPEVNLNRHSHRSRRMSSLVPREWKNFAKKLQETKMVEEDLIKSYINKDFSYGEFNKYGRVNPWCMCDYFEASLNMFSMNVGENASVFAKSTELNFTQGMEGRVHIDQPLKFKVWVSYIGRSTICWDASGVDPSTDEELATFTIQMVTVDMTERKPAPLAHHIRNWCPKNLREAPPQGFTLEFKPETAFKHRFTVNWSDTDFNSHLNQADIMRMSIDCGSFAATQKALSAFSRELVVYDMKRFTVMFVKEARPGEEVLVECWESEGSPLTLNFALSKKGDLITLAQLEYYAGDPISNM